MQCPVYDSLTLRRAAGPGAHSVGQVLTVTAAPTSGTHSNVSPVYGVGCPQFTLATVSICVGPRSVTQFSLAWPWGRAPTVSANLQGLTVTAAPTPDPHSLSVTGRAPTVMAKGQL